jgi:hypothetical protein
MYQGRIIDNITIVWPNHYVDKRSVEMEYNGEKETFDVPPGICTIRVSYTHNGSTLQETEKVFLRDGEDKEVRLDVKNGNQVFLDYDPPPKKVIR